MYGDILIQAVGRGGAAFEAGAVDANIDILCTTVSQFNVQK